MTLRDWICKAVLMPTRVWSLSGAPIAGQDGPPPTLRVGSLPDGVRIDGVLDEPEWSAADAVDGFTQIDPTEGASPAGRTVVRVLAGVKAIMFGIVCEDPDPSGIVSFSVRRDATLSSEDHIRIVLGPFLDGRSGYVFSVNPSGARYDGLINPARQRIRSGMESGRQRRSAALPGGAQRSGYLSRP